MPKVYQARLRRKGLGNLLNAYAGRGKVRFPLGEVVETR